MYESTQVVNGGYSGLANTWSAQKLQLPKEHDTIVSTEEAGKLVSWARKKKFSADSSSTNVYWTPAGPLYSLRQIPGAAQPKLLPASSPDVKPDIKIVRDLPQVDLGPVTLSDWTDILLDKKLIVLSLLAVGLCLYCKAK